MSFCTTCLATATGSMIQEDYVQHIPQMIQIDATPIGGCCGTNPDYIRWMAETIKL